MADAAQMAGGGLGARIFDLNTGQKLSGLLHVGLIAWVMLFDLFAAPDHSTLPEVTEVSIISSQEFAELSAARPAPPPVEVAPPVEAPPQESPAPETVEPPTPSETIAAPAPVAAPAPISPPAPVAPPTPSAPETVSPQPQAAVVAPDIAPRASLRPRQRPAQRVASEAIAPPDPEVAVAPRDQAAVTPDATAQVDAQEAQEATQREAAATEVVTENTEISETLPALRTATAPEVSLRPRSRPRLPRPDTSQPAQATPNTGRASAIESALAEALSGAVAAAQDTTIPTPATSLSQADTDMLRLSIEPCWNVGILSTEALNVVITLAFEMTEDARPIPGSVRQVAAQGGSASAQAAAFDAGRQAIMQCGTRGYGLPADLYDQWRLVEITFNPAGMSIR